MYNPAYQLYMTRVSECLSVIYQMKNEMNISTLIQVNYFFLIPRSFREAEREKLRKYRARLKMGATAGDPESLKKYNEQREKSRLRWVANNPKFLPCRFKNAVAAAEIWVANEYLRFGSKIKFTAQHFMSLLKGQYLAICGKITVPVCRLW